MAQKMKKSITVTVPAYNEEENIERVVRKYDKIVKQIFNDYEIIIFNDGSTDKTGKIADALAKENPRIRVVHNKKNKGLGYNFRIGLKLSKKNYYIMISGEGETFSSSIKRILSSAGKADIIIPYVGNQHIRERYRIIISEGFTAMLNLLFGLHLKYYNSYALHKTKLLRQVNLSTNSFAYQAEAIIQLIKYKKARTYIQVPCLTKRTTGTSCFKMKNLLGVITAVVTLFFKIYFKKKR